MELQNYMKSFTEGWHLHNDLIRFKKTLLLILPKALATNLGNSDIVTIILSLKWYYEQVLDLTVAHYSRSKLTERTSEDWI